MLPETVIPIRGALAIGANAGIGAVPPGAKHPCCSGVCLLTGIAHGAYIRFLRCGVRLDNVFADAAYSNGLKRFVVH